MKVLGMKKMTCRFCENQVTMNHVLISAGKQTNKENPQNLDGGQLDPWKVLTISLKHTWKRKT